MQLTNEDLFEMMTELWSSMLGLGLVASSLPVDEAALSWAASVDIVNGDDVTGTVRIRCGDDMAERISEALFDLPKGSASFGEVRDAMGEVANIVGGNVKGVLEAESLLGLPRTSRGVVDVDAPAARNQLWLESEGHPLEAAYLVGAER